MQTHVNNIANLHRLFKCQYNSRYQVIDDILDVTATSSQLGKAAGSDLLEGKLTLPLIRLLEKEPDLRPRLESVVLDGAYNAITRDEIASLFDRYALLPNIIQQAHKHIDKARKCLDVLSISEYRSCLEATLSFVADRSY